MALSDIDRNLLDRCLSHKTRAWEDFVDRYMGLVVHVVNHTALSRSIRLHDADRDDLVADVFLSIVKDDYAVLRRFRCKSSLATYLTVIVRRIVVGQIMHNRKPSSLASDADTEDSRAAQYQQNISDREEVEQMLDELEGLESEIVRLYHLEGKSYEEISNTVGIPANSIGPTLSRAREKLRRLRSADRT